jgi:hypothetical protein
MNSGNVDHTVHVQLYHGAELSSPTHGCTVNCRPYSTALRVTTYSRRRREPYSRTRTSIMGHESHENSGVSPHSCSVRLYRQTVECHELCSWARTAWLYVPQRMGAVCSVRIRVRPHVPIDAVVLRCILSGESKKKRRGCPTGSPSSEVGNSQGRAPAPYLGPTLLVVSFGPCTTG